MGLGNIWQSFEDGFVAFLDSEGLLSSILDFFFFFVFFVSLDSSFPSSFPFSLGKASGDPWVARMVYFSLCSLRRDLISAKSKLAGLSDIFETSSSPPLSRFRFFLLFFLSFLAGFSALDSIGIFAGSCLVPSLVSFGREDFLFLFLELDEDFAVGTGGACVTRVVCFFGGAATLETVVERVSSRRMSDMMQMKTTYFSGYAYEIALRCHGVRRECDRIIVPLT
ncbi:hypothetical protein AA313_de0204566 [Arthrobotrys entomopaga]|nr:hypothetical protein AA313_de0204566 [Arthrobotrys entomopaga]